MRSLQLLALALLATVARSDSLPVFNYFYSCASDVIDCSNFPIHQEGPTRTFDISAQPANGFFGAVIATQPGFTGPVSWRQVASNNRGEALGYLDDGVFGTLRPVLMDPTGEIFSLIGWALDINNSGLIVENAIDGPFVQDAVSLDFTCPVCGPFVSPSLNAALNFRIIGQVDGVNDANQIFVELEAGRGVLSPFAVLEPSTLLLLATGSIVLACRFRRAASEPTARIRRLQVVVLLLFVILLPRSVQADAVTFISPTGADFQGTGDTPVAELSGGVGLGGHSDSGGQFLFSNPLAPMVGLAGGAQESMGTGPLVAQTDTSWTFHGGNVLARADDGGGFIPLPPGYSTCEAAGFITSDLDGMCLIFPVLSGTLTGDVVLSLSGVAPETSGGFSAMFDITGPVRFDISADLARAGGVSAGPYFGSLTVEGSYFQDTSLDGQAEYHIVYHLFEVSGVIVPEPSTFFFLLTAIVSVYSLLGRRQLLTGKPSL